MTTDFLGLVVFLDEQGAHEEYPPCVILRTRLISTPQTTWTLPHFRYRAKYIQRCVASFNHLDIQNEMSELGHPCALPSCLATQPDPAHLVWDVLHRAYLKRSQLQGQETKVSPRG